MKFNYYCISISLFFLMLFSGQAVHADVQNGLLITSFVYDDAVTVNQEVSFTVEVVDVKVKQGEKGALDKATPANNAIVKVVFSKNLQKIERELQYDKDGKFKGTIIFPEAGDWEYLIVAKEVNNGTSNEHQESDDHENEINGTIAVNAEPNLDTWQLMLALLPIVVGTFFAYKYFTKAKTS